MGEPDEPINGVPSYAQVVQDGDAHDSKPDFVTDAIGTCTEPPMLNGDSLKTVTTNHTTPHETTEASHTATGLERDDRSFAEAVQDGSANGFPDDKQIKPTSRKNGANGHFGHRGPHEEGTARQNGSTTKDGRKLRSGRDTHGFERDDNRERSQGYQAAGVRFAPWSIPLKRRLQTLAVLLHSLTTDGKLRYRSEWFRRHRWWKLFAGYFPAILHKTTDLPPTRKYIFGYHPHGIISHGAFAAFATDALGFSEKFPGITNCLLTLDSNFRIPIYRDYLLALGLRSVSKESIGNILTLGGPNGEGMGRAVTIVVGGARESLEAQPGTMRLILKERKGFIKLAIRTGADLVPVLAFGENDLYDQMNPQLHPWLHAIQMFVLRVWKFTLPFLHGRGIFNYDVGLMPYRRPLHIVVGAPINVAQATGGYVDPAEVDRLHNLYVEELQSVWDRYKDVFAKERKGELEILK
ncbi:diacylglycerol O-acyltransferase 1 [Coniochaeta pulveracea]|uniref:Diacylglycerol O-acyltransferase n=1 Tax=Coniochaeta pulveracea TaxID=177199 RepID=A0A420Y4K7_9PEZI|nr:diacylglycerol O-acyltransferase 1 [Coniochaeta pulveracea]